MCLICSEFIKGTLTIPEAWRNLREFRDKEDKTDEELVHIFAVAELLSEAENADKTRS